MSTGAKRAPIASRVLHRPTKKDAHAFPQFAAEMTDEQLRMSSEIVLKVLASEDTTWERRVNALFAMGEALHIASAPNRRAVFLTIFGSAALKQAVMTQLQDLRSGVVRAACELTTKCCAASVGDVEVFRCACEGYVGVLLTLCVASSNVVAAAADKAIGALIDTGVVTRSLLQSVTASCRSRSAPMRDRAFRYLCTMLCCGDRQALLKHIDALLELIREGLGDAAETSRKYARASFWALHALDDVRCMHMIDSLPDAIQVRMDQDKDTFEALRRDHQSRSILLSAVATQPQAAAALLPATTTTDAEGPRTPRRAETPSKQGTQVKTKPGIATPRGNRTTPPPQTAPAHGTPTDAHHLAAGSDKWNLSMDQIQSTEWSARVTGLTTIAVWLRQLPPPDGQDPLRAAGITKAQSVELTRLLPYRIDDPHYRVSLVALEVLDGLLAHAPVAVLNELPHVLGAVFAATQSKDVVRNVAQGELEVIGSVFDVDVLLAPLYRVVDVANQHHKVKQACFEFLLYLLQKQPKLITPTLLRTTLAKLMQLHARESRRKGGSSVGIGTKPMAAAFESSSVATSTGPLSDAIAACIAGLYQVSDESFVRAVLLLPPSEQEALFVMIHDLVPHIRADVRRAAAGERILPHPAVSIPSPFQREREEKSPAAVATKLRMAQSSPTSTVGQGRIVPTELSFSDGLPVVERASRPTRTSHRAEVSHLHYDPAIFSSTSAHQADVFYQHAASDASPANRKDQRITSDGVAARISRTLQRQAPDVLVLLRTANDSESRRSSLILASVAVTERPDVWVDHFLETTALVMSLSSDGDHSVRVAACRCMIAAVSKCEALVPLCVKVLSMLVQCALTCMEDPFPEVQREASLLFHLICAGGFFATEDVVRALLHFITSRAACTPSFLQALEEIGNTMWRHVEHHPEGRGAAPSLTWISPAIFDALMPALVKLFSHELSEVRKAVVGVLVSVWAAVDDRVLLPLQPLSISQRKLVSIYYHRHAVDNRLVAPGSPQRDLGAEIDARCNLKEH